EAVGLVGERPEIAVGGSRRAYLGSGRCAHLLRIPGGRLQAHGIDRVEADVLLTRVLQQAPVPLVEIDRRQPLHFAGAEPLVGTHVVSIAGAEAAVRDADLRRTRA